IKSNNYGIAYYRSQVDYLPNPSKGFQISATINVGKRVSYPSKDSAVTTTTFSGELYASLFIPITRRNVIRLSNTTKSYYAPKIFHNELFRFGGIQSQRGFDQSSLFAS